MLVFLGLTTSAYGLTEAEKETFEYKKIVLLSQFVKHITWPEKANVDEFVIGIYDDEAFYTLANDLFLDKTVIGRDVVVKLVTTASATKRVNLLYVPASQKRKLTKIAGQLKGHPILIVAENGKASTGSMIQLITDPETLDTSLKVNHFAIKSEGLVMPESSSVLGDLDESELFVLRQSTIDRNKKNERTDALTLQVTQQKDKIIEIKQALDLAKKQSAESDLASQQQRDRNIVLEESITKNDQTIKSLKQESAQSIATLKKAQQTSQKNHQQLQEKYKQLQQQTKKLQSQTQQLASDNNDALQVEAQSQTAALDQQAITHRQKIATLETTISEQKTMLAQHQKSLGATKGDNQQSTVYSTLFYLLLVITIVILAAAAYIWKRFKDSGDQTLDIDGILSAREKLLIKSENVTVFGYLATDTTYAVAGSLEAMLEQYDDNNVQQDITALKPMITLLNNLNDIVADQDETDKQSFDVAAYFNKIITLFKDEFEQSDINYNYVGESEVEITSIPSNIALVFIHLLNNSIKHGFNNNGKGDITVTIEKTAQGSVSIAYQDNGVGMDEATQQQAFTPFFTTKPERNYAGLGLSNTYELVVNKLNGSINLDSQLGKGTTVTITL